MTGPIVVRSIPRTPKETLDELAAAGTATVHEALGRRGFLGPHIRPIQEGVKVAGNAVTVLSHPGDNVMVHAAVEVCEADDVLVVANTAPSAHGMFGDLLATSVQARGVRALVIDAGVRDTADLREMGFPVWTHHVSVQGTVKEHPGSVNVPIEIGGTTISPGDVVCADDDGVVVVPHDEVDECLQRCRDRLAKEKETRAQLAQGELTLEIHGLRAKLVELGVEWVDSADDS
jgi:4-hydroxy-4-methyl-2-oxoglutarate aldolase